MSINQYEDHADDDVRPVTLKTCCLNLRHKLMYCDARQMTPGHVDDSSDTRVFFCVKTGSALGPDGETASPTDCRADRACFCAGRPARAVGNPAS